MKQKVHYYHPLGLLCLLFLPWVVQAMELKPITGGESQPPPTQEGAPVGTASPQVEAYLVAPEWADASVPEESKLADSPVLAVAYDRSLEYRNRGDHWEGIQPRPVSGNLDIELLSASVDYTEPKPGFPVAKLLFYLDTPAQIDLTVRELVPKRYYVLNRVREKETWQKDFNSYQWSTTEVLQPLKLTMTELGVIARVNRTPNRHEESVAPVVFYHSQPPTQITGYRFVFKVGERADLNYVIYQGDNPKPLVEKPLGKKNGGQPFAIIWNCAGAKAGEYELVVDGKSLQDNSDLHQSVKFHHQPNIQD